MNIFVIFFSMVLAVFADESKAPSLAAGFNKITQRFQTASLVTIQLEKIVKSELLGKETTHQAKVFLANGNLRLETESPEKTLFIFDGKTVWNVQYPSEDFGGSIQVTKSKLDKRSKQQLLLVNILRQPLKKNFKVISETKSGEIFELTLQPSVADLAIKKVIVKFADAKGKIETISYEDDLGNLTEMKFKKVEFGKTAKPDLFKYKPEKGSKVTEV